MFPYIPVSKNDEKHMLDIIGVGNIDDLFVDIPENVRFRGELKLPLQKSEIEIRQIMNGYASKNISASDKLCFLGDGTYDSYIPSIVPYLTSRSEFSTAYTPYQPEISQGTLHGIFEFQSLVCNLTDMDASNASMYDGPTAAAEAALMAFDKSKGNTFAIASTVNQNTIDVITTYLKYRNHEVLIIDQKDLRADLEDFKAKASKDLVGVLVQSPNRYGYLEDVKGFVEIANENKAIGVMYADPSSLALLKTPGELGVDVVVGDMQQFGNAMNFGGPHIGFMAATAKLMRKLPGRIAGQAKDRRGNRAFVLTLQAREQHIRRDKAASNICSNQALNALSSTIYMSLLGKTGLKELAINNTSKAHYLHDVLIKTGSFEKVSNGNFYREFVLRSKVDVKTLNEHLNKNNILSLKVVGTDLVQFTVTENRTKSELDYLIQVVEGL
ncbi:MAG: aminomethyl-transferring glycine dehydrogenase subunit GcvPA [Clostridia bacterium]|nr:aminomethyl-transferring glycine dehydrogenase subunit GcvPA [Clostridia bacterium]